MFGVYSLHTNYLMLLQPDGWMIPTGNKTNYGRRWRTKHVPLSNTLSVERSTVYLSVYKQTSIDNSSKYRLYVWPSADRNHKITLK